MSVAGLTADAALILLSWPMIAFLFVGFFIGMAFGATPGVGGSLGAALVLPLTLPFEGEQALVLLVAIYAGAMYGGAISAIVLNVPGTGAAVASTFEGYPMARKGQALYALAISAVSSSLGGIVGAGILIALSTFLIAAVLMFGAPEYALVAVLGLALIPSISRHSPLKALFAGALGLLIATVGLAPMAPIYRYTFGWLPASDGFSYIAVLLGLFAISEMIKLGKEGGTIAKQEIQDDTGYLQATKDGTVYVFKHPYVVVKSAIIGMIVGAIPGAGASVSNIVAYAEQVRQRPDDPWRTGHEPGLIAAEAANNGTVGGSLVPVLSFGIPGSGTSAIILGGLIMHGLRPGPDLFAEELDLTILLFTTIIFSSIIIFVFGIWVITRIDIITRIDTNIIIPMVIVLSVLGGYTLNVNYFDVMTVIAIGLLGYFLRLYGFSIIAFLMGVILGPIVEENLYRSLQISNGSYWVFTRRTLTIVLLLMTVLILLLPILSQAGTIRERLAGDAE